MDKDERITEGNKRKIQKRRALRQSFTAAKRQVFLDNLASCATRRGRPGRSGNVTHMGGVTFVTFRHP